MTDPAELAALYLCGAMPDADRAAFEARLAAGWPAAAEELRRLDAAVVALAGPPVEPPAVVKERTLAALDRPAGLTFRFADGAKFRPTHVPGVSVRLLHVDQERRQFTCLMRMAAGSTYPCHPHAGPEECVVLEGELTVAGTTLRAGDYQRAEAGTAHVEQFSAGGALLFITAPLDLLRV